MMLKKINSSTTQQKNKNKRCIRYALNHSTLHVNVVLEADITLKLTKGMVNENKKISRCFWFFFFFMMPIYDGQCNNGRSRTKNHLVYSKGTN